MRTEESFIKAWADLKWFVKFHNKPCWFVPTEDGYRLSIVKPKPGDLPIGTAANLYDTTHTPIDRVESL